ncbi:MAG: hypothetical protein KF858_04605 [Candidatus Sumerlaeia bacterium]|nr:hypothetical protein [Candidatus Sumerlaeia bacterium]
MFHAILSRSFLARLSMPITVAGLIAYHFLRSWCFGRWQRCTFKGIYLYPRSSLDPQLDLWMAGYTGRHVLVGVWNEKMRLHSHRLLGVALVVLGLVHVVLYLRTAMTLGFESIVVLAAMGFFLAAAFAWNTVRLNGGLIEQLAFGLFETWTRGGRRRDSIKWSFRRVAGNAFVGIFVTGIVYADIMFVLMAIVDRPIAATYQAQFRLPFPLEYAFAVPLVLLGIGMFRRARRMAWNLDARIAETLATADQLFDDRMRRHAGDVD